MVCSPGPFIVFFEWDKSDITPDVVHVLAEGRIVQSGGPELALELEKHGYHFLKDRVVPEAAA